ncbi:MAG: decaprenyl-phosphate phosphoribosyltransferase [Synergistaceae bacterium]|nr:decaprenyl-phosphate phosphoribosyltransferase [Synergistaceae bacterium]
MFIAASPYLSLLRPKQWIKNLFVLIPAMFVFKKMEAGGALALSLTLAAFCLFSSAVYIMNDLRDAESDRLHMRKRRRPIASGEVTPKRARALCASLLLAALSLSAAAGLAPASIGAAYVLLNVAYSFRLKSIPIIDVFCIALGFVLRVYAGGAAIGFLPSPWLMLNTFFLSLFLGFGKRRGELLAAASPAESVRPVLGEYRPEMLNFFLLTSCSMTLVCYAVYTIDAPTVSSIGSSDLVYTVPVAAYGVFRYTFTLFRQGEREDADIAEAVLSDGALLLAVGLWLLMTFAIVLRGGLFTL